MHFRDAPLSHESAASGRAWRHTKYRLIFALLSALQLNGSPRHQVSFENKRLLKSVLFLSSVLFTPTHTHSPFTRNAAVRMSGGLPAHHFRHIYPSGVLYE